MWLAKNTLDGSSDGAISGPLVRPAPAARPRLAADRTRMAGVTALAIALADHRGDLIAKMRQQLPALAARFEHLAVAATTGTPAETLDLLRRHGAEIAIEPPDRRARLGLRHRAPQTQTQTQTQTQDRAGFNLL